MTTASHVIPQARIESYDDMAECNAHLMEDIYNDPQLTAMEKLKGFSLGVRNQASFTRDMRFRRQEYAALGMKPNGGMKRLTGEIGPQAEQKDEPAPKTERTE